MPTTAEEITVRLQEDAYTPEWWANFDRWTQNGRDPVLIKGGLGSHLPGPEEIERSFHRMHSSRGGAQRLRIYIGSSRRNDLAQQALRSPLPDGVPVFKTLQRQTGSERLAFVINDFQDWSQPMVEYFGALLSSMAARRGLPAFGAEQILFAGNYDATPFGAHQGYEDAFFCHFGPGEKSFYLWSTPTYRALTGGTDSLADYARLLPHGIELRLEPKDLLYLPAHWFHIATQTSYSCSMAIAMYDYPLQRWVHQAVTRTLNSSGPWSRLRYQSHRSEGNPLGGILTSLMDKIHEDVPASLDDQWLRCASNAGFRHLRMPVFEQLRLSAGDRVRVRWPFKVCWQPGRRDSTLDVYLRHERLHVVAHPGWPAIFHALNDGEELAARDLFDLFASPWTPQDVLNVLQAMTATGGLERAS